MSLKSESGRMVGARGEGARAKIGLICLRGTSRGINASPYYMRKAMDRWVGDTTHLGDRHRFPFLGERLARRFGRAPEHVYLRRAQIQYARDPQDLLVGIYAGSAAAQFGPTSAPMIYVTDAAAHDLVGTYPQFEHLSEAKIAEILRLEERCVARSEMVVTHSRWAARALVEKAGAAPESVVIIPVGTDTENIPPGVEPTEIDPSGPLEAVFLGRAWERKGLRDAVRAVELLNSRGVPAHLSVLGCEPPDEVLGEHATCFGAFNRSKPADDQLFESVLKGAHVHLLPSLAECFGISVAEAGSYYTPSIVTNVQGLPDAVRDGETGAVVSSEGTAEELADVMASWYADPDRYRELCVGVREDVEERLNWDEWGRSFAREAAERFN